MLSEVQFDHILITVRDNIVLFYEEKGGLKS